MVHRIESYGFGRMVVDGKEYTKDLIILPEGVHPGWWRKKGHSLCLADMPFLEQFTPEMLIIGCGAYGVMKVQREVEEYCMENGIRLMAEKSGTAAELYNQHSGGTGLAGAFHLTC